MIIGKASPFCLYRFSNESSTSNMQSRIFGIVPETVSEETANSKNIGEYSNRCLGVGPN